MGSRLCFKAQNTKKQQNNLNILMSMGDQLITHKIIKYKLINLSKIHIINNLTMPTKIKSNIKRLILNGN